MTREIRDAEARIKEQIKQLKDRLHNVQRADRERQQRELMALIHRAGIAREVSALAAARLAARQGDRHEP